VERLVGSAPQLGALAALLMESADDRPSSAERAGEFIIRAWSKAVLTDLANRLLEIAT
jgi:hypothetical protein